MPKLPDEEPELTEIPSELTEIIAQVNDLYDVYWDRESFGDLPSENEIISHYVVPFLRRLGWLPELIGVGRRHIDIALFSSLSHTPENCSFIIEAKRLGAGVEGALEQARGYAENIGTSCDIVVTDGVRCRLYDAKQVFKPIAYANLYRLKESSIALFSRIKKKG
ncbi:MAG: hypothetical protein GX795_11925 [Firmicutes bacterium]|nr:hypothetical protein [Bacillota bacterium]